MISTVVEPEDNSAEDESGAEETPDEPVLENEEEDQQP